MFKQSTYNKVDRKSSYKLIFQNVLLKSYKRSKIFINCHKYQLRIFLQIHIFENFIKRKIILIENCFTYQILRNV